MKCRECEKAIPTAAEQYGAALYPVCFACFLDDPDSAFLTPDQQPGLPHETPPRCEYCDEVRVYDVKLDAYVCQDPVCAEISAAIVAYEIERERRAEAYHLFGRAGAILLG